MRRLSGSSLTARVCLDARTGSAGRVAFGLDLTWTEAPAGAIHCLDWLVHYVQLCGRPSIAFVTLHSRLAAAVTCEAQSRPGAIDLSSRGRDQCARPPLSERVAQLDAWTRRLRNPEAGIQSYSSSRPATSAAAMTCEAPSTGGEAVVGPLDSEPGQSGGHGRRRPRAPGHRLPT